ncbi:hypothetical protein AHMF7605_01690 [Adhaeribacter arboris]|uniref:eCIS core domain-containing protein n=2 Tax=Adhaeribacter arboris TaxID=2072846 RepID=A0A2T2YNR5_9BACT|nr:hypothetical protein AHMF7605_01690 [Adhaeribacter arboris]
MRMPEPIVSASVENKKEEKLARKEEEEVQSKSEISEINSIQAKEEPEPKLAAKLSSSAIKLARQATEQQESSGNKSDTEYAVSRKNNPLYPASILQRSGRGSPPGAAPFEQTLAASKGEGTAMPDSTRQFMENRFQADFSGVRIHTGSTAESLSSSIQAQAFAHGNDIYFNKGKFSPDSTAGRTLLAHELTHTIQQGASKTNVPAAKRSSVATKKSFPSPVVSRLPSNLSAGQAIRAPEEASCHQEPKIQLKDEADLTPKKAPEIGALPTKTELSTWQVNHKGKLQPAGNTAVPERTAIEEIQPKEEAQEKENATDSSPPFLQKQPVVETPAISTAFRSATEPNSTLSVEPTSIAVPSISPTSAQPISAPENSLSSRAPPIGQISQNASQNVVQCALYDNALARVSEFLTDLPGLADLADPKGWLLGKVRQFASYIPGYRALGVILGHDPITGQEIPRSGRNFLEAGLDIIPGGNLLKQKLEELGILEQAAAWIDTQIDTIKGIVESVRSEFTNAWNAIDAGSILDGPMAIVRNLGNILERALNNIIDFARRAAGELLDIIKKFLLTHIVSFIKEHTSAYELLKVILGKDPITDEPVERNGTNILNALLELGGEEGREQRKQMQETGTFQKAVAWIDRGIAVFGNLYATIRSNFNLIWNVVSIESLLHPVDTFNRIYETFAAPVRQVLDFVRDALVAILGFIKEALMSRLSTWAKTVKGYSLVTVIIGKDPFTNQTVPRTVENMIHGFMSLMDGGEEQFNQMKESGAIARAEQRVKAAVDRLNMTPQYVVQLFLDLWNSFSFADLANPIAAFQRILDRFGEPIGRLIAFVVEIIRIVIDILLQVMQFPTDLIQNIVAKAMQAIEMIKRDPIGFLKNLLRAIKEGFLQFFGNILTHLWNGLKAWFLSEVQAAGIPIPTDFTVMGIIKWLLAVLDVTMDKIWKKLEEKIGKEKVDKIRKFIDKAEQIANAAGEAYEFVQDVRKRGFMVVIVEKIKEKLTNVWDLVLDSVKSFVMDQIINKAIQKVLSMLDPTGIMAVINSAIALYKAIQSFIRYLRQMLEIVNSFVEGTLEIAKGATKKAANFLENSLGRGVPIVIGFLANQIGLNLSSRLRDALTTVREKVDAGLTWLIGKLVTIVEKVVELGRAAAKALLEWWKAKTKFTAEDQEEHTIYFEGSESNATLIIRSEPKPYTKFLDKYEEELGSQKLTKAQEKALSDARKKSKEIERRQQDEIGGTTDAQKEKNKQKKADDIQKLVDELGVLSKPLFGSEKPKDWEISHNGDDSTFATKMEAKRIYKIAAITDKGSAPTKKAHPIFDKLALRTKGNGFYYVRGHLLNDNLGGPGQWNNMTALSIKGNSNHISSVESLVKAAFDMSAVIHYKVEPRGTHAAKVPTSRDKPKFTRISDIELQFSKVKDIVTAESKICKQLKCSAHTMKKEGNKWVDDKEIVTSTVDNPIETDYSTYEVGDSIPLPTVNLTTGANRAKLADVIDFSGNKASFAQKVWRMVDHKIETTEVGFGTYEGLANYQIVKGDAVVLKFTTAEKNYINDELKNNKNVVL